MRLLLVNPNISTAVTALIRVEAERAAAPGTELVMATAGYGFEYIETRLESIVAAAAILEVIAEHTADGTSGIDGVLVAAFGDPGMPGLKEIADVPVIGVSEAALCLAALQGQRISIIAISERITGWYRDCVERFGLAGRLASIRSLGTPLRDVASVQHDFRAALVNLAREAVQVDGADVLILAGAPLAGLAREVLDEIDVPVVDGVGAGVRLLESLVGLSATNPRRQRRGTSAPPPTKPRHGLSAAVTAALVARQEEVSS
jgi:allantoin racemase